MSVNGEFPFLIHWCKNFNLYPLVVGCSAGAKMSKPIMEITSFRCTANALLELDLLLSRTTRNGTTNAGNFRKVTSKVRMYGDNLYFQTIMN